jgi:hypothetical protein
MRESSTYQAVLAAGRAEEAKRILELVAGQRFGPPSARARRTLNALSHIDRIERISARLLTARDWEDLRAPP